MYRETQSETVRTRQTEKTQQMRQVRQMHKMTPFAWILAGIFLVCLILSIWILRPSKSRLVEVVQDDTVLYTFDLDSVQDQEIVIPYQGSSNTILIRDGEIRVTEAECPDQTCVKMGKLYSENLPIVCVPNHLIVRFVK